MNDKYKHAVDKLMDAAFIGRRVRIAVILVKPEYPEMMMWSFKGQIWVNMYDEFKGQRHAKKYREVWCKVWEHDDYKRHARNCRSDDPNFKEIAATDAIDFLKSLYNEF